jgi:hypothetical protein
MNCCTLNNAEDVSFLWLPGATAAVRRDDGLIPAPAGEDDKPNGLPNTAIDDDKEYSSSYSSSWCRRKSRT